MTVVDMPVNANFIRYTRLLSLGIGLGASDPES